MSSIVEFERLFNKVKERYPEIRIDFNRPQRVTRSFRVRMCYILFSTGGVNKQFEQDFPEFKYYHPITTFYHCYHM